MFDGLIADSQPLVQLALQHVDDRMLQAMAALDYGQDTDAHLAALRGIMRGVLPIPLEWVPKEVLELTRNTEPKDESGHWQRVFACLNLLRAQEPPHHEHFLAEEATILRLTTSALSIGPDCGRAARSFLVWCLQRLPRADWLDPYLAIAILLLSVRLENPKDSLVDAVISVVRSSPTEVWELFDGKRCSAAAAWKSLIRKTFLSGEVSDGKLRNFGSYLLLEADLS